MSTYSVGIEWSRGAQPFLDNRYSRGHVWKFDGGVEIPASSSPSVVPLPMSVAKAVDPEEAFLASLSSCHMLWFLDLAARRGFCIDRYSDLAEGKMGRDAAGKIAMLTVVLHPEVIFSGANLPGNEIIATLHHEAHERCFIANSVKTQVTCEPRISS